MNTVHCGARFAMRKSIKLQGGKTVLNTIKAIRGEEKGKYINSNKKKDLRPSHAKYQETNTRKKGNQTNVITADLYNKERKDS